MLFVKIFRCCNFAGSSYSLKIITACHPKFFHSKILYNMKTAYFQHSEGEEKVHVTVNINESIIKKVLNFERNISERLGDFSKRLEDRIHSMWEKKKKKKNVGQVGSFPVLMFLNNEQVPESLVFQELFQDSFNGDLKLKISDSVYDVVINSPLVSSIDLPKKLQVGCIVLPQNCKSQFMDLKQSDFTWYRSCSQVKEKDWEICGEGLYYTVKADDCGYFLKLHCVPKLNEKVGPAYTVVSDVRVEKADNLDVIITRHEFTKEKTKDDEFRIVSYNILADMYAQTKEAKTNIFTFCDPEFVEYSYRKNLLNIELMGYNADILCMQETERKYYNSNLLLFEKWGYEGLYHEKDGTREGSALLYNRNKFKLLTSEQYKLSKELLKNPILSDIKSKIETNTKFMERLNIISSHMQVAVLEWFGDNVLLIGNVHFYFHPDADHIRLLQGVISFKILLHIMENIKKEEPSKKVSILLCGDFNSTPECGIHQLLSEGSVDSDHFGWKGKEDEIIDGVSCSHSLKMKSCYDHNIFTNYVPSFKACIDYIYFQSDHLDLIKTVPVPSEEVLSQFHGIPSQFLPSDHVALIADLKFKGS